MRKILLAGAAMLATTSLAMAADSANVELTSTVAKSCSITSGGDINVGTTIAPQAGTFTTSCNFSAANLTISMQSEFGGLKNAVEGVTVPYDVAYDSQTKASGTITAAALPAARAFTPQAAGGASVLRNFTVALQSALTVGGDYEDTLTISVAP